jgi:hypothetical protein
LRDGDCGPAIVAVNTAATASVRNGMGDTLSQARDCTLNLGARTTAHSIDAYSSVFRSSFRVLLGLFR